MKEIRGIVSDHPSTDLIVAAAVGGFLAWRLDSALLVGADHGQRVLVYATVLAAAATLLGPVAAALALIKAVGDGPRIQHLRDLHGATITRAMGASMRGLGYAGALSLWCLLSDTQTSASRSTLAVAYAAILVGGLRLARAIWVTMLILRIDDADANREPNLPRVIRRRTKAERAA